MGLDTPHAREDAARLAPRAGSRAPVEKHSAQRTDLKKQGVIMKRPSHLPFAPRKLVVLVAARGRHGVLSLRSGELAVKGLRLRLAGANLAPEVEPLHPLVTRSHYYVGNKPANHVTN